MNEYYDYNINLNENPLRVNPPEELLADWALKSHSKRGGQALYTQEKRDALFMVRVIAGNNTVRYHSGGSMKLNACILHLAYMVYL